MYNDNGSMNYLINGQSLPYPVDQAIRIDPFDQTNFYVNYTVRKASFLRGSKIGIAATNLFNGHNIVGVTPAVGPRRPCPT